MPRSTLLGCMLLLLAAAGEPQVSPVDHIHLASTAAAARERCSDTIVQGVQTRCSDFE